MKGLLVAVVLALVLGGGGYWLQQRGAGSDDPSLLRPVGQTADRSADAGSAGAGQFLTAPIERGDVRQTVTTTGSLKALVTVQVGTQLSGQIAELLVDFNDEVQTGQPLAQLDTKSFAARLAEASAASAMAEATVAIHEARLERARVDARDAEAQRAVLQARLDNARARYTNAANAFNRTITLRERGTIATSELEEVESTRAQAAAQVREAEAILAAHDLAVEGAAVDVERARAELANAEAAVPQQRAVQDSVEIDLERTTIRSPIDGVVVGRNIDEGQTVAASLEAPTLFIIAGDLREMEIHARVNEADIGAMAVGQVAEFRVDAYPGQVFQATVTGLRKAPEVVQNVVTYTVVLATTNPDGLLLPGMTATVRIAVHEAEDVLKLPLAALRFAPSGDSAPAGQPTIPPDSGRPAMVWTLAEDGRLRPVTVGIGEEDGAHAALLTPGPLAVGDAIVVGEVVERPRDRLFGIRFGF